MHVRVKMMSKGSKEALSINILLMLLKSKESKVVFVALTQHLMQTCENCIQWPLAPARREGYCEPFILEV